MSARVPTPKLHGYGVRWDPGARLYRVRNERTGQWLHESCGALAGFSTYGAADAAWRRFEPRPSAAC
ncbi:hypothetical protein ACFVVX_11925 [Kitasatospora sp. NPDC058170]|uniref:hypothetical protein n=1 Tax=Kitasatospora sp. NPDC058170 TaxID=3346364 RepID=UPI0036D8667C